MVGNRELILIRCINLSKNTGSKYLIFSLVIEVNVLLAFPSASKACCEWNGWNSKGCAYCILFV